MFARSFIAVSTVLVSFSALHAGDWPTFRGPERSAVSPDTGLLDKWPADGPPLVWESAGAGRGYASLAVVGDRIYTLGDAPSTAKEGDDDEYLVCFDRATGKPKWKTKTGEPYVSRQPNWSSSRSTPTVDDDRVYVLTGFGKLYCCDAATGKEKWQKDLTSDFGGKKADKWGYSESPLIDGDRLICTPGGEEHTMVALDKRSGSITWKMSQPGNRGAGHSSIVISNVGGMKVYVQSTGSGVVGVKADDGKLLWHYDIDQTTAVIPTPIIKDDWVFVSIGYKRGAALLQQVAGKSGDVEIKEIYPLNPQASNKHGGVLLYGDHVYGDTEDQGVPFCVEMTTGKVKWKHRGPGKGSASMVCADGKLFIHFADGTVALAHAKPESFEQLGSFKAPGSGDRPSWSHPVIVDGKLYLREQDRLLCYDVRKK